MPGDIPHAGRRAPERRELAVGTGRRAPFQSRPWLEEPEPQCSPRRWTGRVCALVPEGGRPPAPLGLHRAVCPGRKAGLRVPTAAAPFPLPPAPGLPLPLPAGVCGVRLGQGSLLCERGRLLSPACPVAAPRRDGFSSLWLAHLSHRFCSWVTLLAAEEPACRWPSVE